MTKSKIKTEEPSIRQLNAMCDYEMDHEISGKRRYKSCLKIAIICTANKFEL